METQERMYATTYGFQEEAATNGSSFAPSDPGRRTRPFSSSKHHRHNKCGYENAPTRPKEEDITTTKSPSLLRPISFK